MSFQSTWGRAMEGSESWSLATFLHFSGGLCGFFRSVLDVMDPHTVRGIIRSHTWGGTHLLLSLLCFNATWPHVEECVRCSLYSVSQHLDLSVLDRCQFEYGGDPTVCFSFLWKTSEIIGRLGLKKGELTHLWHVKSRTSRKASTTNKCDPVWGNIFSHFSEISQCFISDQTLLIFSPPFSFCGCFLVLLMVVTVLHRVSSEHHLFLTHNNNPSRCCPCLLPCEGSQAQVSGWILRWSSSVRTEDRTK